MESTQSPWYSLSLSPIYRRILNQKYTRIRESGLYLKTLTSAVELIPAQLQAFYGGRDNIRTNCSYRSLEHYLETKENDRNVIYVHLTQVKRTFLLTISALLISLFILMTEMSGLIGSCTSLVARKRRSFTALLMESNTVGALRNRHRGNQTRRRATLMKRRNAVGVLQLL